MVQFRENRYKAKATNNYFFRYLIILCLSSLVLFGGWYLKSKGNSKEDLMFGRLESQHVLLKDLSEEKIVYQRAAAVKIYPASLTKIMTALVIIQQMSNNPEQTVRIPDGPEFQRLVEEEASMAGFAPGEEITMEDALYGILLTSGAEAVIGAVDQISSSEADFVKLMNIEAKRLGLENTRFTNETGLHDTNHYSTVADLAKLTEAALENELFKQIFTTKEYQVEATNQNSEGLLLFSTLFSKNEDTTIKNGHLLGGKTGYTQEAGLCLASLAEVEGKYYLLVTTKARGDGQSQQYNIQDAVRIYNNVPKLAGN